MSAPDLNVATYLIDRRQMRRKLTFWRVVAIGLAILAVLVIGARLSGGSPTTLTPHVARLKIEGLITGDDDTLKLIRDAGASHAAALLVVIESPGGTTTGSEKVHAELRRISAKKPVVAVVGTMAASGGYIVAMGADRIFAGGNSLVGSIGVLFQFPNAYKLLDTIGVKVETIKSSPLKAAPNGMEPTSEEAKAAIAALVTDSYNWFKGMVQERRAMDSKQLASVSDGRVFTGRQGLNLKLIDEIGGEREAVAWLETNKNITKGLPIRDWKKKSTSRRLGILGFSSQIAEELGFSSVSRLIDQGNANVDAHLLDGLVAIWQVGAR